MPDIPVKMQSLFFLRPWHIAVMVAAGALIRFTYGYFSKGWLAAPDQIAWQLDIDQMLKSGNWNYTALIHAPHEGGSFCISILSMVFRPFAAVMPALSWAALLLDSISRWIQITITKKLWNDQTASWFGCWTILSVPSILPWATINFGLHSLFSFIPFVFVYVIITFRKKKYFPLLCGILSAVSISISYDSIVPTLIVFAGTVVLSDGLKNKIRALIIFLVSFLSALLPHLITRFFLYHDAALITNSSVAIRGVQMGNVITTAHFVNAYRVWFTALPGSFLLASPSFLPSLLICILVAACMYTGSYFFTRNRYDQKYKKQWPLAIAVTFVAAYAFSPFYERAFNNTSYVYYRHLSYIIPLIGMIMIHGFTHSGKIKLYLLTAWLLLCAVASVQYMFATKKITNPSYRAAGWILAKKYGNDIAVLSVAQSVTPIPFQQELLMGFGWGSAAALISNKKDRASFEKLVYLVKKYSIQQQPAVISGVRYAFVKGITPVLDPQLREMFNNKIDKK